MWTLHVLPVFSQYYRISITLMYYYDKVIHLSDIPPICLAFDPCRYASLMSVSVFDRSSTWAGSRTRSRTPFKTECIHQSSWRWGVPRSSSFQHLPWVGVCLAPTSSSHKTSSVFELMLLGSAGDFSFEVYVLLREEMFPRWREEKKRKQLSHNHLCCIDPPLDWWWSLSLFTFCQPLKWLWQEG